MYWTTLSADNTAAAQEGEDKLRNEKETMIVHRLYMVMILELEGVRVERRQDCHITKMSHLHNWEESTRKTINKINTMNYLRVLCRMSSV